MHEGDAHHPTPEDVPSLTLEGLAARGEFLAVTSVALFANPQDQSFPLKALNALAARADDPEAFHWWWRTLTNTQRRADAWFSSGTNLSVRVTVPEPLEDEVYELLVAERSPQVRQITVHDQFKEQLFARLDSASPLARRVAATVLDGRHTPDMLDRAYTVLGTSQDPGDRDTVLEGAKRTGTWDLQILLHLTEPLLEDEVSAVREALRQHLRNLQDVHRDAAATLVARLPLGDVIDLLLAYPAAVQKLTVGAFLQRLGAEQTKVMLEHLDMLMGAESTPADAEAKIDTVLSAVLAAITNLGEAAHELAVWAAATFGAERLGEYRLQQVRTAGSNFGDEERRVRARQRLLDLLAADPADDLLDDLAAAVPLSRLSVERVTELPAEGQRILGGALAARVRAGAPTAGDETVAGLRQLADEAPPGGVAALIGGFVAASRTPADGLMEVLAHHPVGVREAVRSGVGERVALALGRSGAPVDTRVAAVGASLDGGDADVEAFLSLITPAELTPSAAEDLAGHLRSRAGLLGAFCERLVLSLHGPEALAAPARAVAVVLSVAVETGALDEVALSGEFVDAARAAAHVPSRVLQEALAGWLSKAPLSEEALDLVVGADESHTDGANPFAAARVQLAKRFAGRAGDAAGQTSDRIADLRATAHADGATARDVATRMLSTTNVELRRASAEVLAATEGSLEDVAVLEERVAEETDKVARDHLNHALRRIKSGSVAEALHNLLELLELTENIKDPDVAVVLPHTEWHETFVDCVDKLRGTVTTNPEGAVQDSLRLGEFLIDQAVATLWLSDDRNEKQGKLLLTNAPNKQSIGTLLKRQDLLERFPWLHAYATLREDRSVHPAPRGRTTPTAAGATPLNLGLIARVVSGWLEAMYDLR